MNGPIGGADPSRMDPDKPRTSQKGSGPRNQNPARWETRPAGFLIQRADAASREIDRLIRAVMTTSRLWPQRSWATARIAPSQAPAESGQSSKKTAGRASFVPQSLTKMRVPSAVAFIESDLRQTTIDEELSAVDEARGVRGAEQHRFGDLLGLADPTERLLSSHIIEEHPLCGGIAAGKPDGGSRMSEPGVTSSDFGTGATSRRLFHKIILSAPNACVSAPWQPRGSVRCRRPPVRALASTAPHRHLPRSTSEQETHEWD